MTIISHYGAAFPSFEKHRGGHIPAGSIGDAHRTCARSASTSQELAAHTRATGREVLSCDTVFLNTARHGDTNLNFFVKKKYSLDFYSYDTRATPHLQKSCARMTF